MPIFLAPAGSAKPQLKTLFEICVQNATSGTASPDCSATGTASTFTGNAPATVQLSVTNDQSSTVQITAATITVPPQMRVIDGTAAPTKYVSSTEHSISFSGINLPGGKSFTATFQVNVACGGSANWSAETQTASGSGSTFTYQPGNSQGVPSDITPGCHLGFVNQPTDTQTTPDPQSSDPTAIHHILDGGASTGNPVAVGILDDTTGARIGCPTGWEGCTVTVGKEQDAGALSGTRTQALTGSPLAASYGDLTMSIGSDLADQFNLTATGDDGFAPKVTSSSFLVAQAVTALDCTGPGNSCTTGNGHQQVGQSGGQLAPSFVDITSSPGFNFMTVSPFTLTRLPVGCSGLSLDRPIGVAGFSESDSRKANSGTLTIRYYVNKDKLSARYGKNVGNQFVPMCVGARPVNTTTGEISDCDPNNPTAGWLGDVVVNGKFSNDPPVHAICDPDGYYYGIIGSYQDKLDASQNPTVTNWGGTQIGGDNYRFFDMTIPANWDWRAGPG